jgi:hypothetical protein
MGRLVSFSHIKERVSRLDIGQRLHLYHSLSINNSLPVLYLANAPHVSAKSIEAKGRKMFRTRQREERYLASFQLLLGNAVTYLYILCWLFKGPVSIQLKDITVQRLTM